MQVPLGINNEKTINNNKMGFKKGISGNPKGRPKGTGHKKPVSKTLEGLIEKVAPVIEQEMKDASPEVRRSFFMDLASIALRQKKQVL